MPPRKRPFRPDVGTVDSPVFSRASVLDDGLIGDKVQSKAFLTAENGFPNPDAAVDDLFALNSLQLSRDRPIEPGSLIYPVTYLIDSLPAEVQKQVGSWIPGTPEVFNCPPGEFRQRAKDQYEEEEELWRTITGSEYFIWPIEAEPGRFITAIFHLYRGLRNDPNKKPSPADIAAGAQHLQVQSKKFRVVESWSVVDPVRGGVSRQRVNRVKTRLRFLFETQNIRFRRDSYRSYTVDTHALGLPWVPPQTDDWSSGLRSFALIRQLFQRITDFYCNEVGFQDSFFTDNTSGWLNPDQVRHEMMGICAMNCIEDMNYNARISIELISNITTLTSNPDLAANELMPPEDGEDAFVPRSDEDGGMRSPIDVSGPLESGSSESSDDGDQSGGSNGGEGEGGNSDGSSDGGSDGGSGGGPGGGSGGSSDGGSGGGSGGGPSGGSGGGSNKDQEEEGEQEEEEEEEEEKEEEEEEEEEKDKAEENNKEEGDEEDEEDEEEEDEEDEEEDDEEEEEEEDEDEEELPDFPDEGTPKGSSDESTPEPLVSLIGSPVGSDESTSTDYDMLDAWA